MNVIPGLTSRSLALAGGLFVAAAAVVAETVTSDPTAGAGSFLLGGAGLVAAISAFTKDYWSDRQRQRDHEVAVLKLKLKSDRAISTLRELHVWAQAVHAASPSLPAVPNLHLDDDPETEASRA